MSTPITTGSHPQQYWPGVKAVFGASYTEKPAKGAMVFTEVSSTKAYERYVEETGFGLAAIKPEAAAAQYDTDVQGYTKDLVNTTVALGAKISMEAQDDNQYFDVGSRKARKLGRSLFATKETMGSNVLNRGFNSSYTGGDGVELFSTAHPTVDGTQANELAVAADLSEAAIESVLTLIDKATDSRGIAMNLEGMKLVVPSDLVWTANRIVSSGNQSGTANNDINAMKSMGKLPGGVVSWSYLSDPDAWFIVTDCDEGLLYQSRKSEELLKDRESDTLNACMIAIERYAFGWADWRGVYGSPGL